MSSSIPHTQHPLKPSYPPKNDHTQESPNTARVISALKLEPHVEGGYFAEIDRDPWLIPSPFPTPQSTTSSSDQPPLSGDPKKRNASTSIYYLLTPVTPQGHFHRNKGRTVHTLIEGRGRYVLIHDDEKGGKKKRIETFVVGKDVSKGEKAVWIVEGGKYKASFLLPEEGEAEGKDGVRLLISETVVPGFEFADHDFLTMDKFEDLVTEEQAKELEWLVRRE